MPTDGSRGEPTTQVLERLSSARAYIFDFYGTLVEDDVPVPPRWRTLEALGYQGYPELESVFEPNGFDGTVIPTAVGVPSHEQWLRANLRAFIRLSRVPEDAVEAVLGVLEQVESRFRPKAVPRAREMLTLMRELGTKIGLCSNWETPIAPYLEQAGLYGFDAVVISSEVGARKPHPLMFTMACEQLGVDPADAVFVGDSWSADIVGALRAGLVPVWIRRDQASRGLTHLVLEVTSLADLENCLRKRGS